MTRLLFPLLCGLIVFAAPAGGDEPRPPKGFVALFNGKDVAGWHGMPHFDPAKLDKMSDADRKQKRAEWTEDAKRHWSVEGGELVNDGKGACLTTDREFGDVELLLEHKAAPGTETGIKLRASSLSLTGKPVGEWNSFRILQVGERTTVYLNGKLVVDHDRLENHWNRKLPLRRKGPIQLQTRGGESRWRNVFVREIPPGEANDILRKHGSAGFEDVFNGKDFTGWAGPLENYEIKDGAIVCKSNQRGNIHTKAEYADFAARVEYRLPPGGNNGLAIRYPGKGQPSQVAMCEVQILDDDDPKYAKLDPRQYNGSVYGMVAAHRGYLRPAGKWNFMEVTVRGPRIQVELNGTRIVDADVSKVTEFMDNKKHPGRTRTSGYFGFCGHRDPVAFRLVQIKKLAAKP
jgi:hypothetical protein